jgi:hypothetical protein
MRSKIIPCLSHKDGAPIILSACLQFAQSTVTSSPGSGCQHSIFAPHAGHAVTHGEGGPYCPVIRARFSASGPSDIAARR